MLRFPLFIIAMIGLASCQTQSMGSIKPLSAGALSDEYEKSSADVRRKYDGKDVIVTGYAATSPTKPNSDGDQGSVFLTEKDRPARRRINCSFTKDQIVVFTNVKAGQYLTVKGVFSGEAGPELKFCKLVKVE